ncbi:siderophore-interacting protein [Antrihabitans spumae]|uniref:Siderophore-interacting protein n=1 Tax=Antrihabitans spumae TaxID=3373370 RepID=A0ABW7JXC4_9NOCA
MSKYVKPQERHILTAKVLASKQISPNFVRVTVGGEGLAQFAPMGFDQWFRFFFAREGQDELRLPTKASNLWYAQFLLMSKDSRPGVRNYTVRSFRAAGEGQFGDTAEIDIDFVTHGDAAHGDLGIASAWASSVEAGNEVALLDEGLIYNPVDNVDWHLLAGDESALPAIVGILNSAPKDARIEAFIEIAHADDAQEIAGPDGANVHWIVRKDAHGRPGVEVVEAVKKATLPDGPCYAFLAGERELATGLRRHLVNERHVPKANVTFTGYWRLGKAAPG